MSNTYQTHHVARRAFRLLVAVTFLFAFVGSAAVAGAATPGDASAYSHQGSNLRDAGSTESLSKAREGAPADIAQAFVAERVSDLGLVPGDLDMEISSSYVSKHTGVSHVYLQQMKDGIPVLGAILNVNVGADGSVLSLGNRFHPELALWTGASLPSVAAIDAGRAAALHVGHEADFAVKSSLGGARHETLLDNGGFASTDVPAKLVWLPLAVDDVRLAWELQIDLAAESHLWMVYVDAQGGDVLMRRDLVVHDTFGSSPGRSLGGVTKAAGTERAPAVDKGVGIAEYEVFAMPAEYPYENNDPTNPGDDVDPMDPDGGRTVVVDPADPTASPFGWHDTNGIAGPEFTITEGNNARAYTDTDANNVPDPGSQPDGGVGLDFSGALVPLDLLTQQPADYRPAAVVNLFYWNNIVHDVLYQYGFDEPSGNFQENNYGNGGLGSDSVNAEAQDGSGVNNANFSTPADGSNPRMQMFIFTLTSPNRDGDFSSAVISHEYGHGVSNRLTGGPANVFCLNNTEQMGEGWSDLLHLFLTHHTGDDRNTQRGEGTYVLGEDPATGDGIRNAPYSTDMAINDFTYGNTTGGVSIPHGVGFVWATLYWEVYWDLVDEYGFNTDFYADWSTGGNNLAIQLYIDGMKLQPCSPGFVDGRDAILQADVNLTGGANQCLIWEAFARRGLGESADQNSTFSVADNVEAFDVPMECLGDSFEDGFESGDTSAWSVTIP